MKKTPLSLAVSVSICTAFSGLSAYADVAKENIQKEEQTLVWGTQIKASSMVLEEDDIAIRQADHISDLLRSIPGVDVGGAHSLNQRITIRSMDDKDLKITIDGANQNTYMYHHMGNLQIHADILQSVDLEVGTNSVINGGLGGAVRFETKHARQLLKPEQSFGGRVQVTGADNGGESVALSGFAALGDNVDFLLYHNAVSRSNYTVGGGKILQADGTELEGTDGEVAGLEGDLSDTLMKLGWNVSEKHRIKLGYEVYKDEGDYSYRPDMGLATDIAISEALDTPLTWPTEFTRDTLTLNYDADFDHSTLKVSIFDNQSGLSRDESGYANSEALVRDSPVSDWAAYVSGDADNQGVNILSETVLGANTFTYGLETVNYDTEYRASYLNATLDTSSESSTTSALFVQDRIDLGAFAVIPGLRYDTVELESATVSDSFSDTTFALAGQWQVNDALLVKVSETQLFKAPEIGEVFTGAGLFDAANPDIEAETGFNREFSIAFASSLGAIDRISTGATYFNTRIKNHIYDYATTYKDNVGDMAIDGYEVYAGLEQGELTVQLSFSSAESELDAYEEYAALDGARIDRQQGDTFSLNLDYSLSKLNLDLHWDASIVADVDAGIDLDGATSDNSKEGFTVHNVSARWMPLEGLALTLGVDNVFDEFYASQSSRTGLSFHPLFGDLYLLDYEPGRNIKASIAYNF